MESKNTALETKNSTYPFACSLSLAFLYKPVGDPEGSGSSKKKQIHSKEATSAEDERWLMGEEIVKAQLELGVHGITVSVHEITATEQERKGKANTKIKNIRPFCKNSTCLL